MIVKSNMVITVVNEPSNLVVESFAVTLHVGHKTGGKIMKEEPKPYLHTGRSQRHEGGSKQPPTNH